jgi:hypothetical protein
VERDACAEARRPADLCASRIAARGSRIHPISERRLWPRAHSLISESMLLQQEPLPRAQLQRSCNHRLGFGKIIVSAKPRPDLGRVEDQVE